MPIGLHRRRNEISDRIIEATIDPNDLDLILLHSLAWEAKEFMWPDEELELPVPFQSRDSIPMSRENYGVMRSWLGAVFEKLLRDNLELSARSA